MSISSILTGKNIAVNEEATLNASSLIHSEGSFDILPTDKTGRDFRGKGRLEYSKNDTFSHFRKTQHHPIIIRSVQL